MASECTIWEMQAPRNGNAPIRTVPFLAKTSIGSTTAVTSLNKSTVMITAKTTLAGNLFFSPSSTATLTSTFAGFPLDANTLYDFDVRAGSGVLFST